MKKPNYQFEKRQRDLAKKAKKEEKRLKKQEKAANPSPPDVTEQGNQTPPVSAA